jgi:gamma-glutamylcyclotransferase (GGCT)/AIG2-like uncharacterized protein YtfP
MNTNIREMSRRCPSAKNLGKATLNGFELKFRLHADIDQVLGATMEGVLWEITEDCERALDNLEGFPHYYGKIEVVLELDKPHKNMTHVQAMAYTMNHKGRQEPPSLGYENCLREGYTLNGLDAERLASIINASAWDTV